MNSYKLNGIAGHTARVAICKGLGIEYTRIYKEIKDISSEGVIETQDGKKYELKLVPIKEQFTVWVGGVEVNDIYLNKEEAEELRNKFLEQGYDDVVIE